MSFASQTNILAVLTRSDVTRRRGSIYLIKLNFIEEVYQELSPKQMTFGSESKKFLQRDGRSDNLNQSVQRSGSRNFGYKMRGSLQPGQELESSSRQNQTEKKGAATQRGDKIQIEILDSSRQRQSQTVRGKLNTTQGRYSHESDLDDSGEEYQQTARKHMAHNNPTNQRKVQSHRYQSPSMTQIPPEMASKALGGYVSAHKLKQSEIVLDNISRNHGNAAFFEIFLLHRLSFSEVQNQKSYIDSNESFFKVFGLFGYFQTHPVFYALDMVGGKSRVHTFIYNRKDNKFVSFREPRTVDLGICECVAEVTDGFWAVDENGNCEKIALFS